MAPLHSVNVLEHCRIAPPPNSVTPTSLSLTFFDLMWLRLPPVQRLFFYEHPYPTTHFEHSLVPKIKLSLSLTLQHFYPLAGNLKWPPESDKPILLYQDNDSVCLTIAESNADFHHLSGNHARDIDESNSFIPQLPISDTLAPLLALQVTIFPNCGFSVGITIHHAVADGKSSTSFMKAWAFISKSVGDSSSLPESLLPVHDRTLIQDPAGLEAIYLAELLKPNGSDTESKNRSLKVWDLRAPLNTVRATFQLSRADVEGLRKWVLSRRDKDGQTPPVHVSTFALTCGYVMACLAKAKTGEGECNKSVYFGIPVDCRARLNPPIPATYFGNCVKGCLVSITEKSGVMGEDGVVLIVDAIGEAVRGLEKGVLSGAENWLSGISDPKMDVPIGIAGSTRFGVYEIDFGLGRPRKVEILSIDKTGAISLAESRDGDGGVEVGLVLNKHRMEVFASLFADGLMTSG